MPKEIGEKKVNRLVAKFKKIENDLQDIVLVLNSTDSISSLTYNKIRSEMNKQFENFRKASKQWSSLNIPITYDQNIKIQVKKIKNLKYTPSKIIGSTAIINSNVSKATKNVLIAEFNGTLFTSLAAGQSTLLRLIGLTQQLNIAESQIDKIIAEGQKAGFSTFKVKKDLQKALMKNAIDKKYITIIDKNGNTQQWKSSKYAEMVARTKLTETQGLSTINTAVAYNSDLVQISAHNTTSPQCIPFEGKIFSVSGKDSEFPPLTELPPYHPNCLHITTVVFKEVLESRGIKKYSDFSLGKTFEHPTRKSFIPINDLEARIKNDKTTTVKASTLKKQVNQQFKKAGL